MLREQNARLEKIGEKSSDIYNKTKSQLEDIWKKANEGLKILEKKAAKPKVESKLLQEAKKAKAEGKSMEEFVKVRDRLFITEVQVKS